MTLKFWAPHLHGPLLKLSEEPKTWVHMIIFVKFATTKKKRMYYQLRLFYCFLFPFLLSLWHILISDVRLIRWWSSHRHFGDLHKGNLNWGYVYFGISGICLCSSQSLPRIVKLLWTVPLSRGLLEIHLLLVANTGPADDIWIGQQGAFTMKLIKLNLWVLHLHKPFLRPCTWFCIHHCIFLKMELKAI